MIEVNNLTDFRINEDGFKKIAEKVFKLEKKNKPELSIALVKSSEIKKLNKKYRKKNRPTDVLSFSYDNSGRPASAMPKALPAGQPATLHEVLWAGEIVICPQVVRDNSKKFNLSFKKELNKVLIHGILHILGYDHEKSRGEARIMDKKQNHYLEKLF